MAKRFPFKNMPGQPARAQDQGTPAGPGGKWDPQDSPGKDENHDGVYGKPVPTAAKNRFAKLLAGLQKASR